MALDYRDIPLISPAEQIRLLRLRPGSDDTEIQADLCVFNSDACPPYTAISYTWGDEFPTLFITVNSKRTQVRMNAWYSLWQMLRHNQRGHLWIDSICIDQSNIPEKNVQVANMGKIYSRATMTACCLGPGAHLRSARELARRSNEQRKASGLLKANRDSLITLQQNPYFRRIWIKQEIILSKEIRLYCGVDCLDWEDYEEILDSAVSYDAKNMKTRRAQHPKSRTFTNSVHTTLVEGRKMYRSSLKCFHYGKPSSTPWLELWKLLNEYGYSECKEPHDKIYALLPLMQAHSRSALNLAIDYAMPLLTIGLELVRNCVREVRNTSLRGDGTGIVPVTVWQAATAMIRHWFRLELTDPLVSTFTAQWSAPSCAPQIDAAQSERLERLTCTPEYIPGDVQQRFAARGHLNDLFQSLESGDEENPTDFDDINDRPLWHNRSWISDVVEVKDLRQCLAPWLWKQVDDPDEAFWETGDFTFAGLPPDLQVKVVLYSTAAVGFGTVFLVSPNTEIGDDLIVFRLFDARTERFFISIVRPFERSEQLSQSNNRYSVLSGWALQLGADGDLLEQPETLTGSFSIRDRPVNWKFESDPDLEGLPRDALFNLHYEDLVLQSILMQDAASYLTHPCTHKDHPSFLAEDIRSDWTPEDNLPNIDNMPNLQGEISKGRLQLQKWKQEEKEMNKQKNMSVNFA